MTPTHAGGAAAGGAGGTGTGGTSFTLPFDVKLDSQLNLYVSDNTAHRVYKFTKL